MKALYTLYICLCLCLCVGCAVREHAPSTTAIKDAQQLNAVSDPVNPVATHNHAKSVDQETIMPEIDQTEEAKVSLRYEDESLLEHFFACTIKNPKDVKLISKHKYYVDSLYRSKIINNQVFLSSMEYTNWFSLDDLTENTNILRGYWGWATDKYIFGEIEDFWVYDYKNKAYAWRYKYKGWFDVQIKNNEMYIVHENAQEDVYYLDKQRANGALIWSRKMPEFQPVNKLLNLYLIWDNHLIVGIDDYFLASVNAETAEIEWKRDYDQEQDDNYRQHDVTALDRPVFVDLKYRRMLFDYHGVTSVDLESGDVLWTFDRDNRRWTRLLAVYDGIAYLSDLGCSPLIIALDTQNGQELWRYTEEVHHDFRSLFVTDDYVIFGNSGSSVITALNRKTGKLAWKLNVGHNIRVGSAENMLLCQDNKLIVADDYVYVFEVIESQ